MLSVTGNKKLVDPQLIDGLNRIAPLCTKAGIKLSDLSWYKVGGLADVVIEPSSVQMVADVIRYLQKNNVLYTVIGDTSNILFDDAGYRGVLIKISSALSKIEFHKGGQVTAGAGLWVPCFVRNVINRGLTGCVHAIGIPGTLGGLVMMNGGSQRKGIGEQLISATIINEFGDIKTFTKEECRFHYRSSYLQEINCVVVEASFQYESGNAQELHKEGLEILIERRKKFPRKYPNCGSVFLSNPEMYPIVGPPGKAIEDAGLKGQKKGNAQISPLHGNFIINLGGASSQDILYLINECRVTVFKNTGFTMDAEVRYLSPTGNLKPAHMETDELFA